MFSKRKSPASKLLVSVATAVLLVGAASAVTWNNPSSDVDLKDGITLNVSNDNSAENITFQIFGPNGQNETKTFVDGDTFVTKDFTAGSGNYGDYTFKVNTSNDNSETLENVTLDSEDPTVDSFSPSKDGYTSNGDDLDVSYSASDSHSGLVLKNISIFSEGESDTDTDLTGLSLSDGDYTVDYFTLDAAGNSNNGSWDFTVDTSYDGDESPDLPDDEYILLGEDENYDFDVELSEEDEDSDINVECYDGDDDQIDSDTQSVSGDTTFTCEVDGDDYSSTETDVYVKMCDAAGNCKESETETYYFDGEAPEILSSDMPGSIVNSDFPVEYTASDDSSGIAKLEYFYSSDTDEGDGTAVNTTSTDGEFTASVSSLSKGDHTIYFRAKDNAGRWSDKESIDFEYDPDAKPEISLEVPSNLSVNAGKSTSFDISLENTGDIFIEGTNVTVSSEIFSGSESVVDMEPGDLSTVSFDVETSKEDLGMYDMTASMSYPETSKSFLIVVEATSGQEENLDSKLSKYENRLSLLEANWTQKKGGWGKDLQQRFEANFTGFKQRVEDAVAAKESGDYYKVSSSLEGIESDYSAAEKSLQNVQKIDSKRDTRLYIVAGLGLFVVLLGGAGGFLYWSDEYEIDTEKLLDSDIDIKGADDIAARIQTFIGSEEEAEEFEWDGFKDY